MNNIKFVRIAIVVIGLAFCMQSNAALIQQTQNQTSTGQNFNFDFSVNDYLIGTSSTITVTAIGDFASGSGNLSSSSSEFYNLFIEGTDQGIVRPTTSGAYNVITTGTNTVTYSFDYLLNASSTASLLADNLLSLIVDFSAQVNQPVSGPTTLNPQVTVAFNYQSNQQNVPEPSILALLGLGLLGWRFSVKKTK